jgi:hypothetical protein
VTKEEIGIPESLEGDYVGYLEDLFDSLKHDADVLGIMITGSLSTGNKNPRDIDIMVLQERWPRFCRSTQINNIPIEIEYETKHNLNNYLNNYFWYTDDWEIQMGKLVYGRIVHDPLSLISSFKNTIKNYPLEYKVYFFINRLGKCKELLEKLGLKTNRGIVERQFIKSEFLWNLAFVICTREGIFPKSRYSFTNLPIQDLNSIEKAFLTDEVQQFEEMLDNNIFAARSFLNEYLEEYGKFPLRDTNDINGARYLISKLNLNTIAEDFSTRDFIVKGQSAKQWWHFW